MILSAYIILLPFNVDYRFWLDDTHCLVIIDERYIEADFIM